MREHLVGPSITRRTALRRLAVAAACAPFLGAFGWTGALGGDPAGDPVTPGRPATGGKARAVIEVWLSGGPSHVDTFDPKPGAGTDVTGPLAKTAKTNVDGVEIGELLPLLAQQAHRYSLLRGMSHGQNGHETATYIAQTGRDGGGRIVHPCLGAMVSVLRGVDRGYAGRIPPYVVLTRPQGRFSETGFLGNRYRPFVTGGDPNRARFEVEGIVAEGITDERQRARRDLLRELDTLGGALRGDPLVERFDRCEESAYELILGDAGKVFDLSQEPDRVRDRYGRTTFGQSCLAARRLVEQGVPYVTVHLGGWDTHKQHFEAMRRRLPDLDRGLATLLADLAERGLLDSTVVWCAGEFGRTPRVQWESPWNGGRGHHGRCFSALVAGGGFRGGRVVGSTDAKGEDVASRPVHPRELHGAILAQMGIDPDGPLPNGAGLDVKLTDAGDGAGRPRLPELTS